jgi:hypothetical protein
MGQFGFLLLEIRNAAVNLGAQASCLQAWLAVLDG